MPPMSTFRQGAATLGLSAVTIICLTGTVAATSYPSYDAGIYCETTPGYAQYYAADCAAASDAAEGTNAATTRTTVLQVTRAIAGRVTGRAFGRGGGSASLGDNYATLDGSELGVAAGNSPTTLAFWGEAVGNRIDKQDRTNSADARGPTVNFLAGLDAKLFDRLVVGAAISADMSRLNSTVNVNAAERHLSTRSRGLTFTPYAAYTITDNLAIDAQAGFGVTANRVNSGGNVSEYGSQRYFVTSNLYGFHDIGKFNLTGTTGVVYAREGIDSYQQAGTGGQVEGGSVTLGQYKLGGEVGYTMGWAQPYVGATFEYDFINSIGGDRTGALYRVGLNAQAGQTTTLGIEFGAVAHRANESNYSLGANFRTQF